MGRAQQDVEASAFRGLGLPASGALLALALAACGGGQEAEEPTTPAAETDAEQPTEEAVEERAAEDGPEEESPSPEPEPEEDPLELSYGEVLEVEDIACTVEESGILCAGREETMELNAAGWEFSTDNTAADWEWYEPAG